METETIGQRLKAARKAKRLTIRQVADQAGVTFTQVIKVECDIDFASWEDVFRKLARVLEVEVEWIQ